VGQVLCVVVQFSSEEGSYKYDSVLVVSRNSQESENAVNDESEER
jgi:hypothetical protein